MITVTQCAAFASLAAHELIVGVAPSARHRTLLRSYMFNLERGPIAVRDMIVADLRRFHDLDARQCAADLLLVLRLFLTAYPEARCMRDWNTPRRNTGVPRVDSLMRQRDLRQVKNKYRKSRPLLLEP